MISISFYPVFLDLNDISLDVSYVDDPHVSVTLSEVPHYPREHIIEWLRYRGDSLKALDSHEAYKGLLFITITMVLQTQSLIQHQTSSGKKEGSYSWIPVKTFLLLQLRTYLKF